MIFDFLKNTIQMDSLCTLSLIIICGIVLIYLQKQNKSAPSGYNIEHFPTSLHYHDSIRQQPKKLISKLATHMEQDTFHYKTLPDDYDYLYNYEKNFHLGKRYGDFASRLEAYETFLRTNKNSFHNLDDKDVDNLTMILNGKSLKNADIPDNFVYKKDFRAVNM